MDKPAIAVVALGLLAAAPAGAQNLFTNPDLNQNPDGWILACGTTLTWIGDDEAGCPGSGSAHVTGTLCMGLQGAAAGQCVPVGAATTIAATGRVRAANGFAGVGMQFFDGADCTGNVLAQVNSAPVGATGDWQTVEDEQPVPGGSVSVAVGFGALDFAAVDADVDAGYAGLVPLVFRDDFEGNLAGDDMPCRWSAAIP
ncbi:MAG TPA: hypothetical protein VLA66_11220 [Thermoanaerobaculia bacterium]|nr:hypothetical protein [Thermoanaerobaculia bacterium]